jgi:hypothetical protein
MKFILVLLILGATNSHSFKDNSSADTSLGKSHGLEKQKSARALNLRNSEQQPSASPLYQSRSSEDEKLNKVVLASLNAKIPGVISVPESNPSIKYAQSQQQNNVQTRDFRSPQFHSFMNSEASSISGLQNGDEDVSKGIQNRADSSGTHPTYSQQQPQQKSAQQHAQRRTDDFTPAEANYEDSYAPQSDKTHYSPAPERSDYSDYKPYPHPPVPEKPENREAQINPYSLTGPSFVGPSAFDPIPPPPAPIKGSVDYILIPLILIGLAGPIFVVLYVILGAFEAKISPITRSLGPYQVQYE